MSHPKDDRRKLEEFLDGKVADYDKRFYAARQKEFVIHDNLLYVNITSPTGQDSTRCLSFRQENGKPLLMVATIVLDTKAGIAR